MADNEIKIEVDVETDPSGFQDLERSARRGGKAAADAVSDEMARASAEVKREADQMAQAISRELSDIPPPRFEDRIVKPAKDAGNEAADKMADGLAGIDLSGLQGNILAGFALLGPIGEIAGEAIGEELADGASYGFSQNRNAILDEVRTGLSGSEIRAIGEASGEAFSDGFGEGIREIEQHGQLIANTMQGLDDSLDMEQAITAAETLRELWGVEVPESLEIARDLVTSGLAPDTITAYRQMADAQQRYQLDAEEINGVMEEFSSFMGRMGVDGATAWRVVGESARNNVFPTIDRAGEMFENFSISMQERSDEVRQALQLIGVDADEMFALFDAGRGAEAMAIINRALADTGSEADRTSAALAIYTSAWEGVVNPDLALELFSQVDAIGEVGTALDDGTRALEENRTAVDRIKTSATEGAAAWGTYADRGLGVVLDAHDAFNDAVAETVGNTEGATKAYGEFVTAADDQAVARGAELLSEFGRAADEAAGEVFDLDAAFAQLRGQFDGDQAIRDMHEKIRELTELEINATDVSYELGRGFDQTTEAGGMVAEQLEDVNAELVNAAEAFNEGKLSTEEMSAAQRDARGALLDVADQMNLNQEETLELIDTYGNVQSLVETTMRLKDEASSALDNIASKIDRIPGSKTISVQIRDNASRALSNIAGKVYRTASGGPVGAAAGGGLGAPVLVNDGGGMAGPESARLPDGDLVMLPFGSQVNTAEDTQRMLSNGTLGGVGTVINNYITVMGSVVGDREVREIVADAGRQGGVR